MSDVSLRRRKNSTWSTSSPSFLHPHPMETIEGTQNEISKGFRALQRINTRFRKARAKLYDAETSLLLAAAASRGDPIRGKPEGTPKDNKLSGIASNPPTRFRNGQRRWRSSRSSDGVDMSPRESLTSCKGKRRPKTSDPRALGDRLLQAQGDTDGSFAPSVLQSQSLKRNLQNLGAPCTPGELGEGVRLNCHSRCVSDQAKERPACASSSPKDTTGSSSSTRLAGIPSARTIANVALSCPGAQAHIPAYILELIEAHESAIKRTAFMTPEAIALFRPPAWLQKERCRLQQHHPPSLGIFDLLPNNSQLKTSQSTQQLTSDNAASMKPGSRGVRSANQRHSNASNRNSHRMSLAKDGRSLGNLTEVSSPRNLDTPPRGQSKRKPKGMRRHRRQAADGRGGVSGSPVEAGRLQSTSSISQMRLQHIGDRDGPRLTCKGRLSPPQGQKQNDEEDQIAGVFPEGSPDWEEIPEKVLSPVLEKRNRRTRQFAVTPGAGCFASKTAVPLIRRYVYKRKPKPQTPLASNDSEVSTSTEGHTPTPGDSAVVFTSPSNVFFCQNQKPTACQSLGDQQEHTQAGSRVPRGDLVPTLQHGKTTRTSVTPTRQANRSLQREEELALYEELISKYFRRSCTNPP